MTRLIRHRVPP